MTRQDTMRVLSGLALMGGLAVSGTAQAQVNCGAGATDGESVVCNTDGINRTTTVSVNAAVNGLTTLNLTTIRAPLNPGLQGAQITGSGQGQIAVNVQAGLHWGSVNFSGNTGGVTLTVDGYDADAPIPGGWLLTGTSRFTSGADVVRNLSGGVVAATADSISRIGDRSGLQSSAIEFGGGDDRFENAGTFVAGAFLYRRSVTTTTSGVENIGSNSFHYPVAHDLTITDLETFSNTGEVILGGWLESLTMRPGAENEDLFCELRPTSLSSIPTLCSKTFTSTDRETATVLILRDTHFLGGAGSTLIIDAAMGLGVPQRDCSQRAVRGGILSLPGADCLDLQGGKTSGVTQVVVKDQVPGDLGAYNPDGIVIVDVTQGESGAGHFVLSPESDGYDPTTQAIDKGLFLFPLVYDADAQQHKLVSVAGQRAHRLPLLVQAVQGLSRNASRQWFERRDDLRGNADADAATAGAWVRMTHDSGERDGAQTTTAFGSTYGFDNSYEVDSTVFSIGRDFRLGSAWVVGASGSYLNAALDFDQDAVQADFDGAAVAGHASYQSGRVYFDSQLQLSWIEMDFADPRFEVATSQYNVLDASTQSVDARAELGVHLDLGNGLYAEPMLGASWVRTDFSEMTLYSADPAGRPSNEVFGGDTPQSLRASLGGRLGFDQRINGLHLAYLLSARYWEELQGDTKVRIRSRNPDGSAIAGTETRVADTFDSGLAELGLGVELRNASGRLNGFLQANGVFGDYESVGLTAGLRVQW